MNFILGGTKFDVLLSYVKNIVLLLLSSYDRKYNMIISYDSCIYGYAVSCFFRCCTLSHIRAAHS